MKTAIILALTGILVVPACSSEAGEDLAAAVSTAPGASEAADVAAELEAEMSRVAVEIEQSEAASDLRTAWDELQAEIDELVAQVRAGQAVDAGAIRDRLDEFAATLDSLGDDVGDDLRAAWTSLRAMVESLID